MGEAKKQINSEVFLVTCTGGPYDPPEFTLSDFEPDCFVRYAFWLSPPGWSDSHRNGGRPADQPHGSLSLGQDLASIGESFS
jgi:hypothetical protein